MYVGSVSITAVAAVVMLYRFNADVDPKLLTAAICFATLSIFAHALNYQLPRGAAGSIGFIPFLASATLAPGWPTAVCVAAAVVIVEMLLRRSVIKAVFNVAQYTLAVSLAMAVYLSLGGHSLASVGRLTPAQLPAYLAVFVVFFAVNSILVSAAVAINERKPLWDVWRQNTLGALVYDLFSVPVVYIFALAYIGWGPAGVGTLALPILGLRQLYKTNRQLEQTNQELLQLMVAAIEARDPYTSGHSKRVSHYARIIARIVGLSGREVQRVGVAALLHDVGKIHEVYAPILRKPDRLTTEERLIMETHSIKSAELVENVSQLSDLVAPIRSHHENWDGTGYPDSLSGEQIPLAARIVMIADTMDAMTTDRPYRKALGPDEVRAELLKLRGKQFDPRLVSVLLASSEFSQLFNSTIPTPQYSGVISLRRLRSVAS